MKQKLNKIYTFLGVLFFATLFISFSSNPPNGRTGAPGDGLCTDCHNNSNPNGFAGTIDIVNFPSTITPNTTYNLQAVVTSTSGSPVRAGFQAVALDGSNTNAGDFTTTDPNVATTLANSREYVEHDPAVNFSGNMVTYNFDWIAPNANNGEVITVYAAALIGSGNSGNSGDFTITNTVSGTVSSGGGNPPSLSVTSTDVSCFGGNNGTATAAATGGSPGYMYNWSNGGSGTSISNLTAGTYTVTVTDNNSLTSSASTTVGEPTDLIPFIVNQNNVDCFGNTNGSATASANGGTPGYSFQWSNGANTAIVNNLAAGTYTVTVSDLNSCNDFVNVTITAPNSITLQVTSSNVSCNGDNNGQATAFANGGAGNFSFNWSNGMSGQNVFNLAAGIYTVTATDQSQCTQTEIFSINEPPAITLTTSSNNISCNSANDGSASAIANGGAGNFSFNWSNGASGQNISNLAAGTYTVTATDISNCTETQTVTISEPNVINLNVSQNNISCNGANDGSASANANGGVAGFSYTWSNGVNGQNISNLAAGTYTVTATDINNCSQTQAVTISEPNAINLNVSQNNISCNGANDGTASANANGGAGNFSFNWSNGASGQNISNLAAGTYTVTATDINNCTEIQTVTISEPNAINLNVSQNNISCNGANDGTASANANGGAGNFSFNWSNGASGQNISNLAAGTYTVTATDINNCTEIQTVTITEPNIINLNVSQNNISCNGAIDGSASANANGGVAGFAYAWSNGASGQNISNLPAGTYTVTATDINNCSQTESIIITEPNAINLNISQNNISCNGANDGSASANANGGAGNFSFSWSNGASGQNISNLAAGTYTVTSTDVNNCSQTKSITITEPNAINLNVTQNDISCNGTNDGTASANANGGAGNFSFNWSNGASGQNISNLPAGTYTVTATDINNCTEIQSVTIAEPSAINLNVSQNNISCNGANDGNASANANGGVAGFAYAWSNGMMGQNINNLPAGTYTVTATDINNCSQTESITITEPNAINLNISQNNISCNGANDGTASANANGGAGNFSFSWSNGASGQTISNLAAGTYTVTATDASNCIQTQFFSISEPTPIIANTSATGETAAGANDGTATANPSGGTAGYTFSWSNGMTTAMISNLAPGNYTVTITDVNNCTIESEVVINSFNCSVSLDVTTVDPNCFGETGSATANPINATNPIQYLWSTGETTPTIENLVAGNYQVTITDANNCPAIESVTIFTPSQIMLNASTTPVSCNGFSDGSVLLDVTGGVGPYTSDLPNINGLSAGLYTVVVTDANTCTETIDFTITEPLPLLVNATAMGVTANGANDGTATANPSGGNSGYTFNWSNGMTTATILNLTPGNYTVTVTDANLCTSEETVTVNDIGCAILATSSITNILCFGENTGAAIVTVDLNSGTPPFIYNWSNGATDDNISNVGAGTYTITVTDGNNCPFIKTIVIVEPPLLELAPSNQSIKQLNCFGDNNGLAEISSTGGTSPYTYLWSNGATTNPISNLTIGTYTGTVTDNNGCEESITLTITEPTELFTNATSTNETASNANDGTATASPSGGTPPYTYNWSNGMTTPSISNLAPSTYTVTITDDNGCETIQSVDVSAFGCSLTATINSTNATCTDAADGSAIATPTGGTQQYTYFWSSGGTMATESNLLPGTYTVTINDASNCVWIETTTIEVTDNISPTAIAQPITLSLDANGMATLMPNMIDNGSSDNCGMVTFSSNINTFDCNNLGANTVELIATDPAGNQNTTTTTVTIIDSLAPVIICPTNITIDSCTNIVTYGMASVTDNCPDFVVSISGPSSGDVFPLGETLISIAATDASGNTNTCNFVVEITHELSLTATSTDSPCAGNNSGTATANAMGSSTNFTYEWSSGETTDMIQNLEPNTYTVTVTDNAGCTSTSEVTVSEPSALEIMVNNIVDESGSGNGDGAIDINIIGGTFPYTYSWVDINGNLISTDEDPSQLNGGIYILTVTDENDCVLISSEITVGTMVANEDLLLERNIRLFPNPASDQIYLDFDLPSNFDFEIVVYDAFGKALLEKEALNISQDKMEIDISNFSGGMYLIKLNTEERVWIRKFIIN